MPQLGFEPTISAGERPQTYALDGAATGTGSSIDKVTKLRAKQLWGRSSVSVRGKAYFLPHNAETGSGAHSAFCSMGSKGIFRLG